MGVIGWIDAEFSGQPRTKALLTWALWPPRPLVLPRRPPLILPLALA